MESKKYPIGGYAPGNYQCHCATCGGGFIGDKRACQCEPCAVRDREKFNAESIMKEPFKSTHNSSNEQLSGADQVCGKTELNNLAAISNAQPAPRWVKATNYDISKGGMLFYRFDGPTMKSIGIGHFVCDMFHGVHLDVFPKWDWEYLYILDEQPAALKPYDHLYRLVFSNLAKLRARTQNNERMVDMADNIRSIIEDVTAKMMAMPQPDKTETSGQLYQSEDEQPAAGREEELKAEIERRTKLLEDDLKRDYRLNMPGISEQEQEATWQAYKKRHNL